jgi:hypothetical protein
MPQPVLSTGVQGCSPSCSLEPWSAVTYNSSVCIFCMPVPDNHTQYAHYLLVHLCTVSNPAAVWVWVETWVVRVVWPVNSPTATLKLQSTHTRGLVCCTWQRVTHQVLELAATIRGLTPVQVLPSQIMPDDPYAHSKKNVYTQQINGSSCHSALINKHFTYVFTPKDLV